VAQRRDALDVMMAGHAANSSTDPRSFPAFGQTVYAPAAGTVVAARDDLPDLRIGTTDRVRPEGNHVVLDIGGHRYLLLAHLQRGSAEVTAAATDIAQAELGLGRSEEAAERLGRLTRDSPLPHTTIPTRTSIDARTGFR
jgi:hypothetical protein